MSFDFNRSNIDHYLYLVAKEYKKANRANPDAEIIIVGGASMIMNYNFRETTTDIDSIFSQQDLEELFYDTKKEESANFQAALKAEEMYDKAVNKDNINNFIEHFRGKPKKGR